MAPRRKAGLDAEAINTLQGRLADGKRPRVQLSDPSFPVGTAGTVVRIGDPASDGADYITVRVSVNGVADELAFSPLELELPGNKGKATPAKAPAPRRTATPRAATPRAATPRAVTPQAAPPQTAPPRTATPPPTAPAPATMQASATQPTTTDAAKAEQPATSVRKPSARKKSTSPPKITITITSIGATWSVTALRGAKSVAKSISVSPGVVTAVATLLDRSEISAAVAEVNETALAEAESRAAQLRAELAELDAVLAAHRTPS
jgi:hypothetical protein